MDFNSFAIPCGEIIQNSEWSCFFYMIGLHVYLYANIIQIVSEIETYDDLS